MNPLKACLRKEEIAKKKTCLDVNVSNRFFTCECTETACGAKRISCWVKRTLLKTFRCTNS